MSSATNQEEPLPPPNTNPPLPRPAQVSTIDWNQIIRQKVIDSQTEDGGTWSCIVGANEAYKEAIAARVGQPVPKLTLRTPGLTVTSDDFPPKDLKALLREGLLKPSDVAQYLPPGQVVGPGTLSHIPLSARDEEERIRRLHLGLVQRFLEGSQVLFGTLDGMMTVLDTDCPIAVDFPAILEQFTIIAQRFANAIYSLIRLSRHLIHDAIPFVKGKFSSDLQVARCWPPAAAAAHHDNPFKLEVIPSPAGAGNPYATLYPFLYPFLCPGKGRKAVGKGRKPSDQTINFL
ncbi:hypothetical protein BKA70DRAFT_1243162 [Coprinopsis sp. MPI-PUGE-AT-0042]|nr:hypothetical protein BKA70DRAFT_1243162 [Coprinopsis sp. MPI-PUGE-AT-0042]